MKFRYLIAIIIVLIINNFLISYKYHLLKKQNNYYSTHNLISVEYLPEFSLYDLKGVKYTLENITKRNNFTLFIFFSPTDCISCLAEKKLWKLISETGQVGLIGIGNHIDKRELTDWIKNNEIYFPVLFDQNGEFTKKCGIYKTPLKILINQNRKILFIDSVRISQYEQNIFLEKLVKFTNLNNS